MNLRNYIGMQDTIIKNYNALVDALNSLDEDLHLEKLDNDGNCSGLSAYYMFYAMQNDKHTFFLFLNFLQTLNSEKISKITTEYKKNELYWIEAGDKELIEFNDLVRFLKNISLAQSGQIHQLIGAHWERSYTFLCSQEQLEANLNLAGINEGQFMSVSLGSHEFIIERTSEGFYVFESNLFFFPQTLLHSVKDVSENILFNLRKTNFIKSQKDHVGCSIHFLSFNNAHHEVDKTLLELEKLPNVNQTLKSLINEYFTGLISLTDLVLILLPNIPNFGEQNEKNLVHQLFQFIEKIKKLDHLNDSYLAKPNQNAFCDEDIVSLLYLAVQSNQLTLVKKLIASGFNPEIQIADGETPLHVAISSGLPTMVKTLINAGANVCHVNKNNETPISDALVFEHEVILDLLLGAAKNFDPTFLLPVAINKGKPGLVKTLILHHADANHLFQNGQTILHMAAQKNDLKLIEVICQFGKNININLADNFQLTPIVIAVANGNLTMVKMLVENGADFLQQDSEGFSAFTIALLQGKTDIVNYLLSIRLDKEMLQLAECDRLVMQGISVLMSDKTPFFSKNNYPALFEKARIAHPAHFEAKLARQIFLQLNKRTMSDNQIKKLCLNAEVLNSDRKPLLKAVIEVITKYSINLDAKEKFLFTELQNKLHKPQAPNKYLDRFK